jgi:hypothetical protein
MVAEWLQRPCCISDVFVWPLRRADDLRDRAELLLEVGHVHICMKRRHVAVERDNEIVTVFLNPLANEEVHPAKQGDEDTKDRNSFFNCHGRRYHRRGERPAYPQSANGECVLEVWKLEQRGIVAPSEITAIDVAD